jgi:hypothetical protein
MRPRPSFLGLLLLAFAVAPVGACSSQGEGQRCDKNSGDSDCASGLICTTITSSTTTTQTTVDGGTTTSTASLPEAVCCPVRSATTDICRAVGSAFDAGSFVPGDNTGGAGGADASQAGAGGALEAGGSSSGGATGGSSADAAADGASKPDASIDASVD